MNNSYLGNSNYTNPNYNDYINTPNNTMPPNNWNNINNNTNNNQNISNSYAQGILQKNIGMTGYFFVSFPDSVDWRDKIFYGVLTDAGDDYILVYNEDNNEYYLIWSVYLNYATFDKRPNTI